jgi:hypothetical protein
LPHLSEFARIVPSTNSNDFTAPFFFSTSEGSSSPEVSVLTS